jgi:hypothetical protein
MARPALTLVVQCGGMRWSLQPSDRITVRRGALEITTLSGQTLTALVEHLLLTADLVSWVRTPAPVALPAPPALPSRPPVAMPPRPVPFTADEKTAHAARRRARRKA